MLRAFLILLMTLLPAVAQDVRITEFMPVNTAGLKDQDGTFQPWIEIWNPSPNTKVTLTNWRLVHAGSQWFFPAGTEIPPDDYLVVFAGGKNRTLLTAPLHTSFSLSASGGVTLQLLRGDSTVASTFTNYPAVPANSSYGRDGAEIAQMGQYANPTPGNANNYSGAGVAGKVAISHSSRSFSGSLQVSLSEVTPVAGAVIRYTLNGSVPLSFSAQYNGTPISITATTQLRARVYEPGKLPGETETTGYLLLDATTANFHTAAPLIVVSNFGLGTFPDTGDQSAYMWVWEPGADGRARFSNLPTLATRCAVDRRGSSTLGNPKTNFNLEARKARDDDDRDIPLLGMGNGSDWVFHAPYHFDRSLMHNPFMYALSNSIGRAAMKNRMAEVFVETSGGSLNFTGGGSGDYYGLYNVMQKIRRGSDRIDIENLKTYDNDPVSKTGGYIFKVDRQDPGDGGFSAGGATLAYYDPKEVEIKTPQRDPQEQYLTSYINAFKAALDSPNYTNPTTGYAQYLDVLAAVDHHLLNVWSFNVDALRLSGYIHKDRGGKLVYGPIWDFDRALSSTDGRDANPAVWRSQTGDGGTDFFNYGPWWSRLFNDPDFYQKYIDRWVELRRTMFAPATINALLDSLNAELTDEGVARDLARWGQSKRSWSSPFTGIFYPANQAAEVQRIKDYLQQRANFMDSQWVGPVTLSQQSGSVTPGTTITMSAAAGSTIYYTLDGSDPRPSGGTAPAGANVFTYSGPVVVNNITRIKARAYRANWTALTGPNNPPLVSTWSGLTDERYAIAPAATAETLRVTEVHYHPTDPSPAELAVDATFSAADFEFIEVKNVSENAVDLGGVKLSVGARFTFTNDVALTLQPGEFLVIAANPEGIAARYGNVGHVVGPFGGDLSNGGEQLVLTTATGAAIADFVYADTWYPATDGQGKSLEATSPILSGNYSVPSTWRASFRAGGTPGFEDIPVEIVAHPVSRTINPGTEVVLSVVATGLPAPTYQWRFDGEQIEGATSASYTIPAITEAQQGSYDVLVTNIAGTVPSDPAFISVNDPVIITTPPLTRTVNPGVEVEFTVAATGTAPITYQWRKDGENLEGETGASLTLIAAEDLEGTYDVVVSNIVGPVPSEAVALWVNDPVQIESQPITQTVNPDSSVSFLVEVDGTGPFNFQWLKGSEPIAGAIASTYAIPAAQQADEGEYRVVVTNVVGPVPSAPALLVVNDPVQIEADPVARVVSPGGSASLTVVATGTDPLTYQWYRNGELIPGATSATYDIPAVGNGNLGDYTVTVTNIVGSVTTEDVPLSFIDWTVASGNYQGLLVSQEPGVTFPGRITASVNKKARVTGKLEYLGVRHSFKLTLDTELMGSVTVERKGAAPVELDVYLNGVSRALEFTAREVGSASAGAAGDAVQIPKRTKATPAPRAGRYTMAMVPGEGAPENMNAPGFLTLNVSATGVASWVGMLPDATPMRGSGWLSPQDAIAVYSPLYARKHPLAGHAAGPLALSPSAVTGDFSWRKPFQQRGEFWRSGFAAGLAVDGSPYVPPARGVRAIDADPLELRLQRTGGLITAPVQLTTQNKFLFASPNASKVKLSLKKKTGEVKGSFYDSLFGTTRKLHGVILQDQQRAVGFGLGAGQTEPWELSVPLPAE